MKMQCSILVYVARVPRSTGLRCILAPESDNKKAAVTVTNEAVNRGLEKLGEKALDAAMPGASELSKVMANGLNSLILQGVKSQIDKTVDKYKETLDKKKEK